MRSKAWLAASMWLRLARLPPPASRVRRSRRLRDTLAAAPGLLAHASVTEAVKFCPMGPNPRHTGETLLKPFVFLLKLCFVLEALPFMRYAVDRHARCLRAQLPEDNFAAVQSKIYANFVATLFWAFININTSIAPAYQCREVMYRYV